MSASAGMEPSSAPALAYEQCIIVYPLQMDGYAGKGPALDVLRRQGVISISHYTFRLRRFVFGCDDVHACVTATKSRKLTDCTPSSSSG